MMIHSIRHTTEFHYDRPAYESHNEVRMTPRESAGQRVLRSSIEVDPPGSIFEFRDAFGNAVHAISVHAPHERLEITAIAEVERTDPRPIREIRVPFGEFLAEDDARLRDHFEYLSPSRYVPFSDRLRKLFWGTRPEGSERVDDYALRVVRYLRDQFEYERGRTHAHSSLDDVLVAGGGVCQDFAHLTIGILRLAGVPTRYVSGYLGPEGGHADGQEQASHAWIEVLLPDTGWVGYDPTHRGRTTARHIRVAVGRDYGDATPLRGAYRCTGGSSHMVVDLQISSTDDLPGATPLPPRPEQ